MRSIGTALQGVARFVVVLSLVLAFEVVFPDGGNRVPTTRASAIVQSGLLLAVDASDTASYGGSGTAWTDLSGNGKHGTLYSPTLVASTGSTPRAFTTGSNKYMMFPSGFSDFTNGITVQASLDFGLVDTWERIIDFSSDRNGGSFARPDGDNSDNILFARAGTSTDLVLEFYGAYQSGSQYLGACTAASAIAAGVNNYAVTVAPSGGSTTCTIYRNGVALSTSNSLSRMPNNVTRVGNFAARSNWTGDGDTGGTYKSLFIYDRALSASDISANYAADSKPTEPVSLTSTSVTQTSVALSWTAPTSSGMSSITDYVVEYSTNGTSWSTFADGTSTSTTATVTGLPAGTLHHFRVSAKNASGTGPVSGSLQRTTGSPWVASFDAQGGSAVSSVNWTTGQTLTLPAAPTRAGYTFAGWSTTVAGQSLAYQTTNPTRSGNNIVYSAGYGRGGSDAAAVLTSNGATFNRIRYRMEASYGGTLRYADVTFDKWAGATISSLAVPDMGDTRVIKQNVSNMSIESNWPGFAGTASAVTTGTGKSGRVELWPWNYSQTTTGILPAGSGSAYDNDDSSSNDGNYGSFQVHNLTDNQTVLAWNRHMDVNPDIGFGNNLASVNTDWTFIGPSSFNLATWKLQIFIGDLYAAGSTYTPPSNADFTLYAQWTANPLTVTYDSQGGSAVSAGSTVTGGSIAASPGTPTRAGYTFAGWFAASSGGSAVTFPYAHGRTADFTLYAQWTANPLTVTYDSQGGSAVSAGSTVTGGSIAASPGTPTRANHVFKGWFAASSGGSAITFPYAHGRTANFTLYAQWLSPQAGFEITGAPGSLAYNSTVTLGTTGGNGSGAVVFASTSPGVCSVNSGTGLVTMLASTGTCSIAATKAGDSTYDSTSTSTSITAAKASQSALTVTGTSSGAYGATLSLSTTGGTTGGSVTWSEGSSTACTVSPSGSVSVTAGTGTCSITATMAGNTNYLPVESANFTVTVSRATQSTLTVTSTSASYGQDLTLTSSGGSGSGSVTWAVVPATGSTCTVSGAVLTPGDAGSTCVVRATKAQDANWSAKSSSNTTVTVDRGSQTGFSITSAGSFTTGSPLSLTATGGQSTGSVTWSLQSGTCTLSGTSLASTRGGITCSVQATRAGDSNWYPVSDTQSVTVNKVAQTVTIRSTPPSPATVGATYTVTVDSSAFLASTVAIANQSSSVCSVSAGVVTFDAVGTCLISVSQPGNDTYSSAAASQSVTVVAAVAAAPATTQPVASPVSPVAPETTVAAAATTPPVTTTTTTVPVLRATPRGAATTTTTSTTTTTTTTTVPADPSSPQAGADGKPPQLGAGEVSALVQGKSVKVTVEKQGEAVVLTLPNDVRIRIGRITPGGESVAVADDGVLRIYRDDLADVAVDGLVPGSTYTVFMFSDPVELGRGEASAAGEVGTSVRVPDDAPYGSHTLQFNGVGPGGEIVSTSVGFEVLERQDNTGLVVLALGLGVLLALLSGRPVFARRSRRRAD